MLTDPAWIIRQLPDPEDRQSLSRLLKRYELLRVRLMAEGEPFDVQTLKTRIQELEQENRRLADFADRWQKWADENVPKHNRLLEQYDQMERDITEISNRNKELERQVSTLLEHCSPENRILYQKQPRS